MDEKKQIDGMARLMCNYYADDPNCCRCPDCWVRAVAKFLYEAGYRKQEWISVEERLPELEGKARTWGKLQIQPSVRVLCTCVQKSGKVLVKEGFYELWGDRVVWKIPGSIDSVTHWMPLPEPPKMKGE